MNTESRRRAWLFAQAASKLMQGSVRGERPDLHEIDQWRLGTLGEQRADEVLSYVANDELCYGQWRDLCAEQRWLNDFDATGPREDQPKPGSSADVTETSTWAGKLISRIPLNISSGWGAAVAAGLFAVVMVPMIFSPSSDIASRAFQQQLGSAEQLLGAEFPPVLARMTKSIQSLNASATNHDKRQFQLGLSAAAAKVTDISDPRWNDWQKALPKIISCEESTDGDCSEQAIRNQALGSWSLVTALACQVNASDKDFWQQQAETLKDLMEDDFSKQHFLTLRLKKPLPNSRVALCEMANGLLGQGG